MKQGLANLLSKKRVLVGIVSVSALVVVSMSVTFADVDLKSKIKVWADQHTVAAISDLNLAIHSETETQKMRLQQELQARLNEQAAELDAFTAEQKRKHIASIQQYADDMLASKDFSNSAEEKQILQQLDQIVQSAQQAIDNLSTSYTPPASPSPTPPVAKVEEEAAVEPNEAADAEEKLPESTVTESAYGTD